MATHDFWTILPNRGQSIDSPGDPLVNPNCGYGCHITGAILDTTQSEEIDQIRSILNRDYGLYWRPGKMDDGIPRFLEDPAKIAADPSTRQTTRFSILITANRTIFLAPFTRTHGASGD